MNIPKEISDYEKNKKLCNSLKFGDVIINHWASDDNPYKTGVFVKRCDLDGNKAIEITDMKDGFWHFYISKDMKIEFTEKNILSQSELFEKDKRIEELQNHNNAIHDKLQKQINENVRLLEQQLDVSWEVEADEAGLSKEDQDYITNSADEIFASIEEEKQYLLSIESQLTEANKEIERLQNIGIGFCNEIERLKGIIYTAFTHMPNDPFQTEQEAWEQFKAENSL